MYMYVCVSFLFSFFTVGLEICRCHWESSLPPDFVCELLQLRDIHAANPGSNLLVESCSIRMFVDCCHHLRRKSFYAKRHGVYPH